MHSTFQWAICKNRNGESGNGMRRMMRMQGIRAVMRGIMVGMRGIRVGIQGIVVGKTKLRAREYFSNDLFTKTDL